MAKQWCGKAMTKGYTIDHRIPLARGGEHEASNLVLACSGCNSKKGTKLPEEFAGRLL